MDNVLTTILAHQNTTKISIGLLFSFFFIIHYVISAELLIPLTQKLYLYIINITKKLISKKDVHFLVPYLISILITTVMLIIIFIIFNRMYKNHKTMEEFNMAEFIITSTIFNIWFGSKMIGEIFNLNYDDVIIDTYTIISAQFVTILAILFNYSLTRFFLRKPIFTRSTPIMQNIFLYGCIPIITALSTYFSFFGMYPDYIFWQILPLITLWFLLYKNEMAIDKYSSFQFLIQIIITNSYQIYILFDKIVITGTNLFGSVINK